MTLNPDIFLFFSRKTYVVSTYCEYLLEVPRLAEALLMSTHNIFEPTTCFHGEMRTINLFWLIKISLTGANALACFSVSS